MSTTEAAPSGAPQWELHDRLRKSLAYAGVEAKEMADELGLHRNTISDYINGRKIPRRAYLVAWALRCGVPLEWLLTGEVGDDPDGPGGQVIDASGCFSRTSDQPGRCWQTLKTG